MLGIFEALNDVTRRVAMHMAEHKPEIFAGAGTIAIVGGTVMACKATLKADKIIKESKEREAEFEAKAADPECNYDADDAKADKIVNKIKTGAKVVRTYAVPAAVLGLGIALEFKAHYELKTRAESWAMYAATTKKAFDAYRKNTRDRFGDDVDRQLRYGLKPVEVNEGEVDEDGNARIKKKTYEVFDSEEDKDPRSELNKYSEYAAFYDDGCNGWTKDPQSNLDNLKGFEMTFTRILQTRGYLFLNEVYRELWLPETKAGQYVGWFIDPTKPEDKTKMVSFGIYDVTKRNNRDFVNRREPTLLLDFNVDGVIIDKVWKPNNKIIKAKGGRL